MTQTSKEAKSLALAKGIIKDYITTDFSILTSATVQYPKANEMLQEKLQPIMNCKEEDIEALISNISGHIPAVRKSCINTALNKAFEVLIPNHHILLEVYERKIGVYLYTGETHDEEGMYLVNDWEFGDTENEGDIITGFDIENNGINKKHWHLIMVSCLTNYMIPPAVFMDFIRTKHN